MSVIKLSEANSRQTSDSLQPVVSGLHTTISELDSLCKKSSNGEINLKKSDLQKLVKEIRDAQKTINEIIKSYRPEKKTK